MVAQRLRDSESATSGFYSISRFGPHWKPVLDARFASRSENASVGSGTKFGRYETGPCSKPDDLRVLTASAVPQVKQFLTAETVKQVAPNSKEGRPSIFR